MEPILLYAVLYLAGSAAGTLNVIAAGGTFLTLPLLIFLGLPPTVANGTNRVAILAQNSGAVWSFRRYGVVDWRWLRLAALPAVAGVALGAWAAVRIGDHSFQRVLATLMVLFAVVVIWNPFGRRSDPTESPVGSRARLGGPGFVAAFFVVGAYGGFIQAGVGFVLLAMATLVGLDLVRANALKVLVVLAFTPIALAMFAVAGKVHWGMGLALGAGNFTGGLIGARLSVLKGHAWIRRAVLAAIVLFAIKLWISP